MIHFKTISDLRRTLGFPPPEHPQLSLQRGLKGCPLDGEEFTIDCYLIAFKKFKSGLMLYGRTSYDHSNGVMSFIRPRQIIHFQEMELEEDNFLICIHEDFLNGHILHDEMQKYGYFNYESNEALHLSPREEEVIRGLYARIEGEYYNNLDEYSRGIILTHIDSILKYAQRFYRRQFINRTELSGKTVSKFNEVLSHYFSNELPATEKLPSVHYLAAQLHLSARYLSDLLKQETGKTAIELIHIYLIGEAKNRLKQNEQSISEIAFTLGFQSLSYFSKLFRKEVGVSPMVYKKQLLS